MYYFDSKKCDVPFLSKHDAYIFREYTNFNENKKVLKAFFR